MSVQERVERRAQDFVEIQLVWTVLFQDFSNMARRPVREEGRDRPYPAFELAPREDSDCIVSFTRAGLPASAALPAGMQRLSYCIRNDNLYRAVWPVLDRPADGEPQESLLIEDIDDFVVETYPEDFGRDLRRSETAVTTATATTTAAAGSEAEAGAKDNDKDDDKSDDKGDDESSTEAKDKGATTTPDTHKYEELPVGVKVIIEVRDEEFVRWFPGGEEYRLDVDDK